MRNPASAFSTDQLKKAIQIREQIDNLERELEAALGRTPDGLSGPNQTRRRMSLAARRKIAAGQKARWAKTRRQDSDANGVLGAKRVMSNARRAKLSAAARARWAKARAEGRTRL